MLIKSININNLRNISSAKIEAGEGLNILYGDNGTGKTTVLEAMILLAKGRSFRTGQVASLIGPDGPAFMVTARVWSENRASALGIERSADHWRARRDGEDVRQLSELAELLPLVLMEPSSHTLITGPPDGRRRYLDWGVFHVEHRYLSIWRRYSRAVKQRNAALRSRDERLVSSLDPVLADLGQQIDEQRMRQVAALQEGLPKRLTELAPDLAGIELRYQRGWPGDKLLEALEQSTARDLDRGMTGPGPHRADLLFQTGDLPARESLSRGELKTVAAALLLAQADAIAATGIRPVLLLDDLASEFDARHRASVLGAGLASGAQIWLTGTALDKACLELAPDAFVFHVEQGRITRTVPG